jgi:hypothetical protein
MVYVIAVCGRLASHKIYHDARSYERQNVTGMFSCQGRRPIPAKAAMVTRTTFEYGHKPKRGPYQDTDFQYSESPDRDTEWLRINRPYKLGSMLLSDDGRPANTQNMMFNKKPNVVQCETCIRLTAHLCHKSLIIKNSSSPPYSYCYYPSTSLHGIGQLFPNFWYKNSSSHPYSSCYYPFSSSSSSLHGIGQVLPNPGSRRKLKPEYTSDLLWLLHTCWDSRLWVVNENIWWPVL